ncbi:MAG: L-threonylcarbamoyladenylate synthase [Candidatus Gastranaerophilaceae bacterium]|jgi:L-threonylcarbamoyladenylate synthase
MLSSNEINLIKDILNNNGVIAIPTDTVWGLACLPDKITAVKKIYNLKGRNEKKPLILMSSDVKYLIPYIKNISPSLGKICSKYFPGQLTVITQKSNLTQKFITSEMDTVGIRVPDHSIFAEIAEKCAKTKVLATTSANISGFSPALNKQEVQDYFGDKIDYIVDDFGFNAKGTASTVIKVDINDFKVLRQGLIKIGW